MACKRRTGRGASWRCIFAFSRLHAQGSEGEPPLSGSEQPAERSPGLSALRCAQCRPPGAYPERRRLRRLKCQTCVETYGVSRGFALARFPSRGAAAQNCWPCVGAPRLGFVVASNPHLTVGANTVGLLRRRGAFATGDAWRVCTAMTGTSGDTRATHGLRLTPDVARVPPLYNDRVGR